MRIYSCIGNDKLQQFGRPKRLDLRARCGIETSLVIFPEVCCLRSQKFDDGSLAAIFLAVL